MDSITGYFLMYYTTTARRQYGIYTEGDQEGVSSVEKMHIACKVLVMHVTQLCHKVLQIAFNHAIVQLKSNLIIEDRLEELQTVAF